MATVVSTLYPPLIETFMPAFPYNEEAPVTFSFSPYNSLNDIKKIHVSLVNQKTNQSAFKNSYATSELKILNNIWILNFSILGSKYLTVNQSNNTCIIKIPPALLKGTNHFVTSNYYKVQIRFDSSNNTPTDTSYFSSDNRQYFSEWSSVCLIKAIPKIEIGMADFDSETVNIADENAISNIRTVQPGIVPLSGRVNFVYEESISTKDAETMQKYKITILDTINNEILDATDWVYTNNNIDPNKIYWLADLTNGLEDQIYNVIIEVTTKNQYYFSKTYQIKMANFDALVFNPIWTFTTTTLDSYGNSDNKIVTEEDGMVHFNITSKEDLPQGFLYVKRASSLDNFKNWELLSCTKNTGVINKNFTDATVKSLVKYRYACQYRLQKNGAFTATKYSQYIDENENVQSIYVYPDFYDLLIMRQNRQLAIRYNGQITSYTPVVNRQVINTLGGKYPKFAENANMNYKKFTVTGLITAEEDYNRKFLDDTKYVSEMEDYNNYVGGKYEIRNDTIADGDLNYTNISPLQPATSAATKFAALNSLHDLYPKDNWWLEREFREQVVEWLNDGEPKLFRSMTEGNMAVMITDVSLTPNTQLGRRTYNISMTVYEVGDGTSLEVLSSLGIIDVPDEYSDYINAGIADEEMDSDDSDDGIIVENVIGQLWQKKAAASGSTEWVIGDDDLISKPSVDFYTIGNIYNGLIYQGALDSYKIVDGSLRLQDLKIQFLSKPQWYNVSQNTIELSQDTSQNLELGYKLGLKTESQNGEILIFVEEKGYYQVPSNLLVTEIMLYDSAVATMDYKLSYKRTYDESSIPTAAEVAQKIVGQISGRWNPSQQIANEIKNKYEYYRMTNQKQGFNGLLEKQYLDQITAFGFDGTSYATFDIKFTGTSKFSEYVVGRTGVYNLMTDYPIDEVTFSGRRMFRKKNEDYYNYRLNPYELDESTSAYQGTPINNFNWTNFETSQQTNVLIVVNNNISTPIVNQINRNWIEPENMPYESTTSIDNPKANTIYGIYKDNDVVLMLYTPNGNWVQVNFINAENHLIMWTDYNMDPIPTGKKKFFLEEWEFDLDSSADNDLILEPLTWYKTFLGNTHINVNINESSNINNFILNIKDDYVPIIDGYKSIKDIKNPEYNIVYGFNNGTNQKIYKIYYIDQQWYDIEFITQEQDLILAKVPVYGMVNYRGNLVKIKYE